jgi:hypothetical protein
LSGSQVQRANEAAMKGFWVKWGGREDRGIPLQTAFQSRSGSPAAITGQLAK